MSRKPASSFQLISVSRVLKLALPVMLANISVPLVGVVDSAVMGRLPGADYLAAVAIATALFSTLFWAFGFFRMGTGGMVAQAAGAEESVELGRIVVRNLVFAAAVGLLTILLATWWLRLGMHAMQAKPALQALVADYYYIRVLSAPATLMLFVLFGTLIGLQRMTPLLLMQLLLNVLNVGLNIAQFVLFDWDVRGVAIATVISEYLTLAAGLYLIRKDLAESLCDRQVRLLGWFFEPAAVRRLWSISADLFIRSCCLTFAYYWLTVLGSRQGAVILAANTLLLHLLNLMAHLLDGFAHAVETLAGQAIGRRRRDQFNEAVRISTLLALVLALLLCLVFGLAGTYFVNLLTLDKATREFAYDYLPWIYLTPLLGIWSFLLDGIFIGSTRTREMRNGMIISLLCFIVVAEVSLPLWGNHGLWIAYYALLIMRTLTLGWWFPRIGRDIHPVREL